MLLIVFTWLMMKPTTVFVGDSIVHAGNWRWLCLGSKVIAKPSGTSRDVLAMVPAILEARPAVVVLMVGVNDIVLDVPAVETVANVAAIRETIEATGARVLVHALLPVTENYPIAGFNARIDELNALLPVDRIRLQIPRKYYTNDGIHLRADAYRVWVLRLKSEGVCL